MNHPFPARLMHGQMIEAILNHRKLFDEIKHKPLDTKDVSGQLTLLGFDVDDKVDDTIIFLKDKKVYKRSGSPNMCNVFSKRLK